MSAAKKRAPGAPEYDEASATEWMRAALEEARLAMEEDEVPVGCVVVNGRGEITGRGRDRRHAASDPLAHAEIEAIRQAAAVQGDWRLDDHTLVVTLEPCPMCAAVISFARIRRLYYGAPDPKGGGIEHGPRVFSHATCHHRPELYPGLGEHDSADLLKTFFAARRAD